MALARCGNENALYIGSGRRGAHCHAGEELAKRFLAASTRPGGGVSLGLPRGPVRLLRSHPRLLRGREGSEKPRGSLRRSAYIGFSSIETAPRQHADRGSERKLAAQ
ncbi:unnamed protein product [Prorocentrum cordatum]|uniref:Uncharacterized protein n=1 Tax=Prorocentrum cordatum TaxID=2364126 RepID=A0ABN9UQB5_9DINO|nr:unnamed protein product [Polarella glacialis]